MKHDIYDFEKMSKQEIIEMYKACAEAYHKLAHKMQLLLWDQKKRKELIEAFGG